MAETDDWVAMASEYRAIAHPARSRGCAPVGARARTRLLLGASEGSVSTAPAALESVDLATTSVRDLNQRLHDAGGEGRSQWQIENPEGAHALAAGLDGELEVEINGHVGYYCAGMNKHATVRVAGNCGVGVAENMMSGTVIVEGSPASPPGRRGAAACWSSRAARPPAAGSR